MRKKFFSVYRRLSQICHFFSLELSRGARMPKRLILP